MTESCQYCNRTFHRTTQYSINSHLNSCKRKHGHDKNDELKHKNQHEQILEQKSDASDTIDEIEEVDEIDEEEESAGDESDFVVDDDDEHCESDEIQLAAALDVLKKSSVKRGHKLQSLIEKYSIIDQSPEVNFDAIDEEDEAVEEDEYQHKKFKKIHHNNPKHKLGNFLKFKDVLRPRNTSTPILPQKCTFKIHSTDSEDVMKKSSQGHDFLKDMFKPTSSQNEEKCVTSTTTTTVTTTTTTEYEEIQVQEKFEITHKKYDLLKKFVINEANQMAKIVPVKPIPPRSQRVAITFDPLKEFCSNFCTIK